MASFAFTGTGVAIITPFTPDDQVDTAALTRIVNHLISGRVDYIVALGTTGETATLEADEKIRVLETIFEAAANRIPVVLGIGGNHTAAVCKTVQQWTKRFPAAGVLSVSPYYNKPSQEGIYQHYRQVAAHTDLPVILYNVPPRTASHVTAETTLRIANDCPNVVATKEASGSLEQCMDILRQKPEGFELLSGDDLLTLPLIALGGKGVISVSANALPGPFSEMTRAALEGNWELARKIHYQIQPLVQLNFAEGNPTGVKTLMQALGLCGRETRMPLMPGSESLLLKMQAELAEIQAFG